MIAVPRRSYGVFEDSRLRRCADSAWPAWKSPEAQPKYTRMISYDKIREKLEALHVRCL